MCITPKLDTCLFHRTTKISLEATKWEVAPISACSQYLLGQAQMEQPPICGFNSLFSMPTPQTCIQFLCLDISISIVKIESILSTMIMNSLRTTSIINDYYSKFTNFKFNL